MKDGGPAFPACEITLPAEERRQYEPITFNYLGGMSLRDYFAAAALQGLITTVPMEHQTNLTGAIYAPLAYKLADAMLAERDK